MRLMLFVVLFILAAPTGAADIFGELKLIEEVDCSQTPPGETFKEIPAGISKVETILGAACRVMANDKGDSKLFAYRIGKGKGLKPNSAYVLSVEFPDDRPRGFQILNWGCETSRGVATGQAIGDAMLGNYVNHNPESLKYPQTGKLMQWRSLFFLHDRSPDLNRPRDPAVRPLVSAADGFWVSISQYPAINDPLSAGAAVSKIRLFEVVDFSACILKLNIPPDGLPRRHIFWREEMADGVIHMGHKPEQKDEKLRGVKNIVDWYEQKAKLMQALGINTFCKDLLEFGHNQGWDATDGGGNDWYWASSTPQLWGDILTMLGKYKHEVIPYYEYAGSVGGKGLGSQGRARTLAGKEEYTHVKWTEKRNVDFADPDFIPDAKKLLDVSLIKYKDRVKFIGAWFRPRPSANPISFNDNDLKWFGAQANNNQTPAREQLKGDKALLEKYYAWWFGKRKEFLITLRDHLRAGIGNDAIILYTTDASEPGLSLPSDLAGAGAEKPWEYKTSIVTDDKDAFAKILQGKRFEFVKPVDFNKVVAGNFQAQTLQRMHGTWGEWEWQHSCPPADPANYKNVDGILFTYSFNRLYTVGNEAGFEAFRGPSGLAAVRHYALNENEMYIGDKKEQIMGYFVCDVERAGAHCMLAEARAVANGDPWQLGYLMGNSYNRGFPEYVRNFNAAFLALPALPSAVVKGAASSPEVVVRSIKTPKNGTYFAVVNTGFAEAANVTVTLPSAGKVTDAATGAAVNAPGGKVMLTLYSGELRALKAE